MAKLIRQWNNGGSLSVSYEGDRDGSAIFSSEVNEGLDREMLVVFADSSKTVRIEKKVRQDGMREEYVTADNDVYITADNEIYGCLKV